MIVVKPGTLFLEQVKALGKRNADRLGFLPEGAFDDYAGRGGVLAFIEENQALAYTIFRIRRQTLVLVHLCVSEQARGRGIAHVLVDHLATAMPGFAGIQARCRADYPADAVWPRLGFTVRKETSGRSIRRATTLRVWWRDLGLPDLFSTAASERPLAAIDMNVLVDFQSPLSPQSEESKSLLSDWFGDVVELVITDEVYTEIKRNPDAKERRLRRQFASSFREVSASNLAELEDLVRELEGHLGPGISDRERSDRRHLAKSILGGARFFVTRDTELLDSAGEIETLWEIAVVRPCDLIAQSDAQIADRGYSSSRLSGSHLTFRRLTNDALSAVLPCFQALALGERKGPFQGLLRNAIADPTSRAPTLISNVKDEPVGLLVTRRAQSGIDVEVLRTAPGTLGSVLARHLVWIATRESVSKGLSTTRICDTYLSKEAKSVLSTLAFREISGGFVRLNAAGVTSTSELASWIRALNQDAGHDLNWLEAVSSLLDSGPTTLPVELSFEIEKAFWPAKLVDTAIPCFTVPIRPEWAASLFHERLANQTLFGADPVLMLRLENVYYRAARPAVLQAPSRVLWYITDSAERPDSKCFVAAALVHEVAVGTAKSIYKRFKRFGVYQWSDIEVLSKGDPDASIMAFRFGHTEVFNHSVPLTVARSLAAAKGVANIQLQSPFQINSAAYHAIYRQGVRAGA